MSALKHYRRWRAERANARGNEALDRRALAEAASFYRRAITFDSSYSTPLYNLGLVHKWRREWRPSLECNERALALDPGNQGACWNLGIAATAVGEWPIARRAWTHYGISVPEGEGPIDGDLGLVPIRLSPDSAPEVIWCRRLDPARARITGVPFPESDRRFGDLLLHDGEPRGTRRIGGREVSVFDEIVVLEASRAVTYAAVVDAPSADDSFALETALGQAGHGAEDWTRTVRLFCTACSEGKAHEHEEPAERAEKEWNKERSFGIGSMDGAAIEPVLAEWAAGAPGRAILRVERVL